ncbi:two pore calcium channel protein 1 [Frankliniella occidentalis]|uniref:Two pore calcium channel protein 1 n=1 Tax=Frankliniella occidentalis TaxID=133901 RepID=A0A6J1S7S3_FRAOC|nr:two pore calcium channel protein 1 [Frankliniella occidentalis]
MASAVIPNLSADGYTRFNDDTINLRRAVVSDRDGHDIDSRMDVSAAAEEQDLPNMIGSQSSLDHEYVTDGVSGEVRVLSDPKDVGKSWETNYHEAAIFLEEGANNEKFDSHPSDPKAVPAYLLVHNNWYYGLDLFTSSLLLILALGEDPAVTALKLPVAAHSIMEIAALITIAGELFLKLRWIGWRTILRHKRTAIKCLTLVVMFFEALVVLIRRSSHFRVTRAFRPIFLIDTRSFGAVRRFIRQILQSMPPILDMMGLLFFFVSTFALLGFFLFSEDPHNPNFSTLTSSFVSMFVLLTTANFPDVMMPAYSRSTWYALFFISYLCIVLYVLMNLMLAVVYETFTRVERDKFRKLLLHKRQACRLAFRLLVSKQNPTNLRFRQFEGLMHYYAPNKSPLDVLLMFHYLDQSGTGALSQDDFFRVYDAVTLTWEPQFAHIPWFHTAWPPLQNVLQKTHDLVHWKHFELVIYVLIICNGIAMVSRIGQDYNNLQEAARAFAASWDTILFLAIFVLEALLKVLGMGLSRYFSSGWNVYDFTVTLAALLGVLLNYMFPRLTCIVVLRPLRLLRLFKMKKRYRDVFGTVVLLSPLMSSALMVILVLYYFFAIIGMELFAGYNLKNCCNGTPVEDFYRWSANTTSSGGYYYLNNFENIAVSFVTLFELMVVNNWFIVMNAYAVVVHPSSRLYFMLFYLLTSVVLTIVVASVLEAFRFRIQYKRQTTKREEEKMLHEELHLKWEEISRLLRDQHLLDTLRPHLVVGGTSTFIGCRPRNREVLQNRMYRAEIEEWMNEAAAAEKSNQNGNQQLAHEVDAEHVVITESDSIVLGVDREDTILRRLTHR